MIILKLLPFLNPYRQGLTPLQVPVPAIRGYHPQLLDWYLSLYPIPGNSLKNQTVHFLAGLGKLRVLEV
jgi:uncharacterized protein YbgA (DUF1722 family)